MPQSGEGDDPISDEPARMWFSVLLAAAFLAVGVVLVVVGGWFGLLVGVVALLMGLVLLVRGYRLRSARA
jgi:hypothetical protein